MACFQTTRPLASYLPAMSPHDLEDEAPLMAVGRGHDSVHGLHDAVEGSVGTYKVILNNGNYLEKCPVGIWKRYIPLLIDLLISNNFSSMTFFLRNAYFTSYRSSKYSL